MNLFSTRQLAICGTMFDLKDLIFKRYLSTSWYSVVY